MTWLPFGKGRINGATHMLLTFHYIALSRIFFRAPDLDTARSFIAGLVRLDPYGVRPDLASGWLWAALVFGLAYHFTPRRWVDVHIRGLFHRTPGVLLGLIFAALCFFLMRLLEGSPRAFIYFQF